MFSDFTSCDFAIRIEQFLEAPCDTAPSWCGPWRYAAAGAQCFGGKLSVSHRKLARCKGNITWLAGAKLLNQSHWAIHNSYPLSFYMFLYDKVATIRIEPIGTGSDRRLVSLGLRGCICCLEESVSTDWHTLPQKQKVKTLNRKVGSC